MRKMYLSSKFSLKDNMAAAQRSKQRVKPDSSSFSGPCLRTDASSGQSGSFNRLFPQTELQQQTSFPGTQKQDGPEIIRQLTYKSTSEPRVCREVFRDSEKKKKKEAREARDNRDLNQK